MQMIQLKGSVRELIAGTTIGTAITQADRGIYHECHDGKPLIQIREVRR